MLTKKEFRKNWVLDPSKEMVVEAEIDAAYIKYKLNLTQRQQDKISKNCVENCVKVDRGIGDLWMVYIWKYQWIAVAQTRFQNDASEISKMIQIGKDVNFIKKLIQNQHKTGGSKFLYKRHSF